MERQLSVYGRLDAGPTSMASNPFSTRFIRPGALEFLFPPGLSAQKLVEILREQAWQGQVIGPHGSGKSTLLAALVPALAAAGRKVVERGVGQSSALFYLDPETLEKTTVVIIDGFEQLSWWSRRKVKRVCRDRGAGLLVTAHRDMGLPTLWQSQPSLELAQAVVSRLLSPGDVTITADDVARAFEATRGNLRETLFALYDVYQQRR